MQFKVIPDYMNIAYDYEDNVIYLERDEWEDRDFRTTFNASYNGKRLGVVKIGYWGMKEGEKTYNKIPKAFNKLDTSYFSLWQSEKDYGNVVELNKLLSINVFELLNDVAYDLSLLAKYSKERSLCFSLFRSISKFQCEEQFHRIATGGVVLRDYHFLIDINESKVHLEFDVYPKGMPPSNIHVLIGRNGIGKTKLIKDFVRDFCGYGNGRISLLYRASKSDGYFANVICVSFSPFDDYSEVIQIASEHIDGHLECSYIGLDRNNKDLLGSIKKQFIEDFAGCLANIGKTERWKRAMEILESDPMFKKIHFGSLVEDGRLKKDGKEEIKAKKMAGKLFSQLSSGHKCVLSIITSCVNKLEERTLVLIDEPENHLHPPLLESLVKALSYILYDRNGVAIISTHSPVVLQEVPRSCVWILNRFNDTWCANRPNFETFGADIGSLTREVFGLEVTKSGYHTMIKDAVDNAKSIQDVKNYFGNHLGNEALGLVSILWAQKNQEGTND